MFSQRPVLGEILICHHDITEDCFSVKFGFCESFIFPKVKKFCLQVGLKFQAKDFVEDNFNFFFKLKAVAVPRNFFLLKI